MWHLIFLTSSISLALTDLPAACLISNLGKGGLLRQPCPPPAWCSRCCWGVPYSVHHTSSRATACFEACMHIVTNTHWLMFCLLAKGTRYAKPMSRHPLVTLVLAGLTYTWVIPGLKEVMVNGAAELLSSRQTRCSEVPICSLTASGYSQFSSLL